MKCYTSLWPFIRNFIVNMIIFVLLTEKTVVEKFSGIAGQHNKMPTFKTNPYEHCLGKMVFVKPKKDLKQLSVR